MKHSIRICGMIVVQSELISQQSDDSSSHGKTSLEPAVELTWYIVRKQMQVGAASKHNKVNVHLTEKAFRLLFFGCMYHMDIQYV